MVEKCSALCQNLQSLTGINMTPIYPDEQELFAQRLCPDRFCLGCPYGAKNEFNTHFYGLSEAYRWDGKFIYYCPMAMIFVAAAILSEDGGLAGGIIAGPIIMGEIEDSICYNEHPELRGDMEKIPRLSTVQVSQLAEMLCTMTGGLYYESFTAKRSYNQQQFLNAIYDMRENYMGDSEHYDYILTAETQLCKLISSHDRDGAQDLLDRLLGHIFFYHAGDLAEIKARTLELIVVISRSVIAGGAHVGDIFRYNTTYLQEITRCSSIDALSRWLSDIVQRFIAVSFDYTDIKHSDIVYKTMDYIRKNCLRKLSLEEIANAVYLSKAYLSNIFKQETGISITEFINRARIDYSKKLLRETSLSLVDIANECCFGDQSYFSRVFKKYEGMSPKKYRSSRAAFSQD